MLRSSLPILERIQSISPYYTTLGQKVLEGVRRACTWIMQKQGWAHSVSFKSFRSRTRTRAFTQIVPSLFVPLSNPSIHVPFCSVLGVLSQERSIPFYSVLCVLSRERFHPSFVPFFDENSFLLVPFFILKYLFLGQIHFL